MAQQSGHIFNYSKSSFQKIEWLLPKLKYSVLPSKIVQWLEQFDEGDLPIARDFLYIFEYISFTEFQYRLEDELKDIIDDLGAGKKILMLPYGKFGKSGTLVSYPISHTPTFQSNSKHIYITNDFKKFTEENIDAVIFIDDFIGTGSTFIKEYKRSGIDEWLDSKNVKKKYLLSAVIMKEGKEEIEKIHPDINIFAQERMKIFNEQSSVLESFGAQQQYLEFIEKYEKILNLRRDYLKGYKGSESLIAFAHGTPNNSFPIFWWGENWIPLYPRFSTLRMDEARDFKKGIAFFIGVCNRFGVDLYSLEHVKWENRKNHNSKVDHSLIALLILKQKRIETLAICHLLGLTMKELRVILEKARELEFLDLSEDLTPKGITYIRNLKKKIRSQNFRSPTDENLKLKDKIYVPLNFKGMT